MLEERTRRVVSADPFNGHGAVVHDDPEMRCIGRSCDQPLDFGGVEKLDTVITPEILSLVMPVVRVGLGIALLGIDDERTLASGQLAVRHRVYSWRRRTSVPNAPTDRM